MVRKLMILSLLLFSSHSFIYSDTLNTNLSDSNSYTIIIFKFVDSNNDGTISPKEIINLLKLFSMVFAFIVAFLIKLPQKTFRKIKSGFNRLSLKHLLKDNLLLLEKINDYSKLYIKPNCQSIDPCGGDEPKHLIDTATDLFNKIDQIIDLDKESKPHHIFILADSGMGKSAFVYNYYRKFILQKKLNHDISLIDLGKIDRYDPNKEIKETQKPEKTVLLLDAFDEDVIARKDYKKRLDDILEVTQKFYMVIITCRTQFFPKDEEIFKIPGRLRHNLDDNYFRKLYLTPFSNEQVKQYLRKKYCFSHRIFTKRKNYKKALEIIERIPNLIVRPMILTYMDDILESEVKIKSTQQLYQIIIGNWLSREEKKSDIYDKEQILECTKQIADTIYKKGKEKGGEYLSYQEFNIFFNENSKYQVSPYTMEVKSLLNKDFDGNIKFSHRSFLEFFIAELLIHDHIFDEDIDLTDNVINFLIDNMVFGSRDITFILYRFIDSVRIKRFCVTRQIPIIKTFNMLESPRNDFNWKYLNRKTRTLENVTDNSNTVLEDQGDTSKKSHSFPRTIKERIYEGKLLLKLCTQWIKSMKDVVMLKEINPQYREYQRGYTIIRTIILKCLLIHFNRICAFPTESYVDITDHQKEENYMICRQLEENFKRIDETTYVKEQAALMTNMEHEKWLRYENQSEEERVRKEKLMYNELYEARKFFTKIPSDLEVYDTLIHFVIQSILLFNRSLYL
ncbi:MAG: hypothetical protein GY853_00915 [PVC group bacterium]|nr:hypothetical protein [PVC group bacterium]